MAYLEHCCLYGYHWDNICCKIRNGYCGIATLVVWSILSGAIIGAVLEGARTTRNLPAFDRNYVMSAAFIADASKVWISFALVYLIIVYTVIGIRSCFGICCIQPKIKQKYIRRHRMVVLGWSILGYLIFAGSRYQHSKPQWFIFIGYPIGIVVLCIICLYICLVLDIISIVGNEKWSKFCEGCQKKV